MNDNVVILMVAILAIIILLWMFFMTQDLMKAYSEFRKFEEKKGKFKKEEWKR